MVKQRLSLGLVLLTATSMFAAANCDNGDTVVSVNVSYDSATASDVQSSVKTLHITISPKSGGSPVSTDIDIDRDSDGGITNPAYKRVTVNGLSGMVDVTVDAKDSGGMTLLTETVTETLVEHGAVAAFVKFARMPAAMPDAGTGSGGATATGGTTGSGGAEGTGGANGSGGAEASGGAGEAGGAKGSGGSAGNTMAATQSSSGGNRGTGGA